MNPPQPPEWMAKIPDDEISTAKQQGGDQVAIKQERISPVPSGSEENSGMNVPHPSSNLPSTSGNGPSRPAPCETPGPSQASIHKTAASQLRELLRRPPLKRFKGISLPGDLTPPSTPGSPFAGQESDQGLPPLPPLIPIQRPGIPHQPQLQLPPLNQVLPPFEIPRPQYPPMPEFNQAPPPYQPVNLNHYQPPIHPFAMNQEMLPVFVAGFLRNLVEALEVVARRPIADRIPRGVAPPYRLPRPVDQQTYEFYQNLMTGRVRVFLPGVVHVHGYFYTDPITKEWVCSKCATRNPRFTKRESAHVIGKRTQIPIYECRGEVCMGLRTPFVREEILETTCIDCLIIAHLFGLSINNDGAVYDLQLA
ncbi:hypothetical protein QAD02_021168 [Eretmocerus hayati]|uniref:Uncharacterized protein n=1 Tax=Eretmocerus hayati TaxID=131215 RepID=A0ACC2PP39_9HYME|nr:hypothetical protein QAD02_021168 [Eretmocerus hayati]